MTSANVRMRCACGRKMTGIVNVEHAATITERHRIVALVRAAADEFAKAACRSYNDGEPMREARYDGARDALLALVAKVEQQDG